MTELAKLHIDGNVATLTINRPDQANALNLELLEALTERVEELSDKEGVLVTVLTGAGRAFCAGMDLKQVILDEAAGGSGNPEIPRRLLASLGRLTVKIRTLTSVTVAEVNGAAIGGGCGLACVCDLAVTHADAKLGFPEVDLGLCPAVVAPWLVRKIGAGPARAMLLRGGVMSGEEAYSRGIVDVLADSRDELETVTRGLVERLSKGGEMALAATKGLLNDLDGSRNESIVLRGAELSAHVLMGDEGQAALVARAKK